jgi:tripartite-type tricarboxylate transporter receptor subunit TctC
VKEKLSALGFVPVASTPGEFGARIKTEIDKWAKVVRDAKLRVD